MKVRMATLLIRMSEEIFLSALKYYYNIIIVLLSKTVNTGNPGETEQYFRKSSQSKFGFQRRETASFERFVPTGF